jgi:protein TonB
MLELRRRAAALKARQRELLVASQGAESRWRAKNAPAKSAQIASGHDLAEAAREMMRLEGEIARNTEAYNSRPRKVNIGTRVQEYRFAQYVEDWRQKVERWGTLNYPEGARGKIYGELVLSVTIGRDGHVIDFTIDRPSPHKLLNEAARKIIMMAAPYAPFPPSIARDTDQVVITRTATFTKGNSLETR